METLVHKRRWMDQLRCFPDRFRLELMETPESHYPGTEAHEALPIA